MLYLQILLMIWCFNLIIVVVFLYNSAQCVVNVNISRPKANVKMFSLEGINMLLGVSDIIFTI